MKSKTTFKCLRCREKHLSDARNRGRQRYCAKVDCRRASKAASQARWNARWENEDYFRGAGNVERVRAWRADHYRWPNHYFHAAGLFCLEEAWRREFASLPKGAKC